MRDRYTLLTGGSVNSNRIFVKSTALDAIQGVGKMESALAFVLFSTGTQFYQENQSTCYKNSEGDKQYQHNTYRVIKLLTAAKVRNFCVDCTPIFKILFSVK